MSTTLTLRDPARARAARRAAALLTIAVVGLAGCSSNERRGYYDDRTTYGDYSTASIGPGGYDRPVDTGVAAWDGDISSPGMTAAHASLPLGSWARVTNTSTAATATVRITRRLAPGQGRDIELSRDAAAAIGALQSGATTVMIEPLDARQLSAQQRAVVDTYVAPAAPRAAAAAPVGAVAYSSNVDTGSIAPASYPAPAASAPAATYGAPRYLQLGSYRDPSNAYRMKQRIEREGLSGGAWGDAMVTTTVINGISYHRVRLGPIASPGEGQRALRQAQALGHNDARLLTR